MAELGSRKFLREGANRGELKEKFSIRWENLQEGTVWSNSRGGCENLCGATRKGTKRGGRCIKLRKKEKFRRYGTKATVSLCLGREVGRA